MVVNGKAPGVGQLPLSALLESLLFVADGPIAIERLATALDTDSPSVDAALTELERQYASRGVRLQRHGGQVQMITAPEAATAVERFLGLSQNNRLSTSALETLAIVAYRQPISRPHIEAIRGVNCDGVIKTLLSKGLIEEQGRLEGPGRPILYGTTFAFLQHFGLRSLEELPPLEGVESTA